MVTRCPEPQDEANTDFAEALRTNMQEAHDRARECLGKSARRQKRNYDRHAREKGLTEGQLVWLYNPAKKKNLSPKLQLRWEGPWIVVKRLSDVTVRIRQRTGGKPRVVHVDRLKPYEGEEFDQRIHRTGESGLENSQERLEEVPEGTRLPSDEAVVETIDEVGEGPIGQEAEAQEPSSPRESPIRRYPKRSHQLPLRYR